jgi:integrase
LAGDKEGRLFRTAYRRTGTLTNRAMTQSDAGRMLQRRAREAGIPTAVCNHTFRATGTAYLDNGGSTVQQIIRPAIFKWRQTAVLQV